MITRPLSLVEFFDTIEGYFPKRLIKKAANLRQLSTLINLLPHTLVSKYFLLECALEKPYVDMSFHLDISTDEKKQLLREAFRLSSLQHPLQQEPSWHKFCELIEKGVATGFFSRKKISELGLEFDVGSTPSPNLFVKLHRRRDVKDVLHFLDCDRAINQTDAILAKAEAWKLKILTIGFMTARAADWIKVSFRAPHMPDILEPFLQKIGYSYSIAPLLQLVQKIRPFVGEIDLQIDILDRIRPKIGIECYPGFPRLAFKWAPVLEMLTNANLITAEYSTKLLSWLGGTVYTVDGNEYRVVRYLYFKIVYEPGTYPMKIKVYLCATYETD